MSEESVNVRDQDVFEPVSEVAGNFEIVFNAENPELDTFESYLDQVVLTIGKTGRANRLSFDQLNSESIDELIDALEQVRDQVDSIEKHESVEDDEPNEVQRGRLIKIKTTIDAHTEGEDDTVEVEKVLDEAEEEMSREKAKELVETLKREGELFEPAEGEIQKI